MPSPADQFSEPLHSAIEQMGWKQGTLFRAPGAIAHEQIVLDETGQLQIVPCRNNLGEDHLFVIASQECDIVSPHPMEITIEALHCTEGDNRHVWNSARFFVINKEHGIIAHATERIIISKSSLLTLDPISWPNDEASLRDFGRWLGARFSRVPIPTPIVDAITKPLFAKIKRERKDQDWIHIALDAVREFRLVLDRTGTIAVGIYLLLGEKVEEHELDPVVALQDYIAETLNGTTITKDRIIITRPADMRVLEYIRSARLSEDDFSHGLTDPDTEPISDSI